MNILSNDRRSYIWSYVVGILSLAYYLSFYNYGLNLSDEGYLVYGAERLMSGQIPGADFHAYMPGRYLVLAFLFDLFGENIIVERLMWVVVRAIIAILFFRLSTRFLPPLIAFVPTLLVILIPGPWHKGFETLFPLAWLLSVRFYLTDGRAVRAFVMGLLGGATLFFRVEMGLMVIFLSIVTIGMKRLSLRPPEVASAVSKKDLEANTLSQDIIIFLTGPVLIFLPYLIFLWFRSGVLKSFFFYTQELFAGLGGSNPFLRPLPSLVEIFSSPLKIDFGGMLPYFLYFFFIVYAVSAARLIIVLPRRKWAPEDGFLCIITIYGMISLYTAVSQPDRSHLLQVGPLAYLLTGFVLYQCYKKIFGTGGSFRSKNFLRRILGVIFVCCSLTLPVIFVLDMLAGQKDFYYTGSFMVRQSNMTKVAYSKAGVFLVPEQGDQLLKVVNFIKKNARINDGLLTILYSPMFNFLTERHNPTFYDIFFPHHVGSIANQKEIIEEIEDNQMKFIVATEGLLNPTKRGLAENRFRSYAKELVRFIENNYAVVEESGPFTILQKK